MINKNLINQYKNKGLVATTLIFASFYFWLLSSKIISTFSPYGILSFSKIAIIVITIISILLFFIRIDEKVNYKIRFTITALAMNFFVILYLSYFWGEDIATADKIFDLITIIVIFGILIIANAFEYQRVYENKESETPIKSSLVVAIRLGILVTIPATLYLFIILGFVIFFFRGIN